MFSIRVAAATYLLLTTLFAQQPPSGQADVFWITIQGLRPADLDDAATAPTLNALARKGVVFDNAFAASPDPIAATIAPLFSLPPSVIANVGGTDELTAASAIFSGLGFRIGGYFSRDLTDASTEPLGVLTRGLSFVARDWEWGRSAEKLPASVNRLLAQRQSNQGIFYWAVLPWLAESRDRSKGLALVDASVQQLLGCLDADERSERWVMICGTTPSESVTEGEDLVTDRTLRVPLIVLGPRLATARRADVVSTLDILPTLLDLTGDQEETAPLFGRSFADMLHDSTVDSSRTALSQRLFLERGVVAVESSLRGTTVRLNRNDVSRRDVVVEGGVRRSVDGERDESLLRTLEDESVRAFALTAVVRSGGSELPALDSDAGRAYHAQWLANRNDPRARTIIADIIRSGHGDQFVASSLLLEHGSAEDRELAATLLANKDPRVRALAGAFLVSIGDADRGLDHAIDGLRLELADPQLTRLLDVLGKSKSELVRAALASFDVERREAAVRAYHDLALARLGDSQRVDRLAEHLLRPRADYPRRPFIDALSELAASRLSMLLAIAVERTELSSDDALHVLAVLERLDATGSTAEVALLLDHGNVEVRGAALDLLRRWQSARGAEVLIDRISVAPAPDHADLGNLLAEPGLLGSPLLPGTTLDAAARESAFDGNWSDGYPELSGRGLNFRFSAPDASAQRVGLVLRVAPDVLAADLEFQVRVGRVERRVETVRVAVDGGLVSWLGELPVGALEVGVNLAEARVRDRSGRKSDIVGLAFFVVPRSRDGWRAIGGVDRRLGRESASLLVPRGVGALTLTARGDSGACVELRRQDEVVARIEFDRDGGNVIRSIKRPSDIEAAAYELVVVGGPPNARAAALLSIR